MENGKWSENKNELSCEAEVESQSRMRAELNEE